MFLRRHSDTRMHTRNEGLAPFGECLLKHNFINFFNVWGHRRPGARVRAARPGGRARRPPAQNSTQCHSRKLSSIDSFLLTTAHKIWFFLQDIELCGHLRANIVCRVRTYIWLWGIMHVFKYFCHPFTMSIILSLLRFVSKHHVHNQINFIFLDFRMLLHA